MAQVLSQRFVLEISNCGANFFLSLFAAKSSHQLALFYLANDIVQYGKRKSLVHYVDEFKVALREACKVTSDEKIIPNINRVLNIWVDRAIYDNEFVQQLRDHLASEDDKMEAISKIVSNYSSNDVVNQINNVTKAEQLSQTKLQSLVNCKVDFANSELLNKLKDKSYGEQFSKEFDEATKCLEAVIMALESEVTYRKDLIEKLEKSKIFYDVQLKEAKTVAEAFNNCELSIKHVQSKLSNYSNNVASPSLSLASGITTSQLSSVLNLFKQGPTQSTLDQRLTNLMSNSAQFGLNLNPESQMFNTSNKNFPTSYNPSTFDSSLYSGQFYLSDMAGDSSSVKPPEPSENLEPADMDLGNSDDEDNAFKKVPELNKVNNLEIDNFRKRPIDTLPFITSPDMGGMFPLMPPPPPPPMPPKIEGLFNDLDNYSPNLAGTLDLPPPPPPQGNLISSLGDRPNARSSSYHHPNHQPHQSNHWHNESRHRSQNYHNYSNSNRHGNRWKNGGGGGGGGGNWKRNNHGHY